MTKRIVLQYLADNEENIQTFIESRTAQKIWDDGYGAMTESIVMSIIDSSRNFISFPESYRGAQEEDFIEAVDDYVIGRFLDRYASAAIAHMKDVEAEMAREGLAR